MALLLTVTAAAGLAVIAPDPAPAHAQPPAPQGDDLGVRLYARDCAGCHGPRGEGGIWAPSLSRSGAAAAYYYLSTGRMPIARPDDDVRRRPSRYDPDELAALVDHVAALGVGQPVPDVAVAGLDVAAGGELYRLHCAVCHSATGIGGALAFDRFAPSVLDATPTEVGSAIVAGPGAMPAFAPDVLSDVQVSQVAAYVAYLQEPRDPGGLPLGRAGRADEGVVAWVVGLGALLVAAGWIGARART